MKLQDLSIADLSALLATFSRRMSALQEKRDEENTKKWEDLAFKRGCIASEVERRINQIQFPKPFKG